MLSPEEIPNTLIGFHTLERLINILQSSDKYAKKNAFVEIKNTLNASSEWTMLKGDNKFLTEFINPVSRRLLDDSPFVRMLVFSLTDECEDIAQEAKALWDKAGNQYVRENEREYKDRMDYEPPNLPHYPPGVQRPGLGCRILIERECGKFVQAIGKELCDWVALVKVKAAQLLSQLTLHAEQNITMQMDKIIGPMSKAAMDNEVPAVVSFVRLAAYYMGFFVPPKVYCDLIVEYMKEANQGERRVIASVISGSKREDLREHLPKVATTFCGRTFKGKDQEALLEVISSVLKTCQEDCLDIGEDIFCALIGVIGLAEGQTLIDRAEELLEEFVKLAGGDKSETYDKFCGSLLNSLKEPTWTVHCHEQFIFYAMATRTGEIISTRFLEILGILKDALSEKSEPEVKLKIYMAVNEIIKDHEITLPTSEIKEKFSNAMLDDLLPMQLKWYPGQCAEAIRTIASTSLYLILTTFKLELQIPPHIPPLLQGLIEDPAEKTRILGLLCISAICNNIDFHDNETYPNLITNVLKRLDDCDKKVRELSIKCIQNLYEAHLTQELNNYLNKALLDFAYQTLIIHLDDAEKDFREKVFCCLESIGKIEPAVLREKLLVQNFRDKEILARLTTSLEETLKDLSNKESKRTSEGSEVINEDLCNTIKTDQKLEVSKIVNDCGLQLSDNLCKLDLGKQSNQLIDINKSDQVESNSDQRQELNFNEISSNVKKELKSESEKLIHLGDGDS
uniref:TOG domain-containing protein n=1 Tax=Rhodnius prolixus TaxID=13249 RepID=T1HAC8_RHOPR